MRRDALMLELEMSTSGQTNGRLQEFTARLAGAAIPVLQRSSLALAALARDEDRADARAIAAIAADDPLFTLKLLVWAAAHRPARMQAEVENAATAVLLAGVSPVLREFGASPVVERQLEATPQALRGLRAVLRRAHRAAAFALAIAIARKDGEAEILHEAALLNDFAEALLWIHAPQAALEIDRRQRLDPALRSVQAQHDVLGFALRDLEQALMRAWNLPQRLLTRTDWRRDADPHARTVLLAVRLARHSQYGWSNPALPDDFREIGDLIGQTPEAARRRMLALDV